MKKTVKDGICTIEQEQGKTLSYAESSGITLIEQDGFVFKDLERTGKLLPYEDWRLPAWDRALDLSKRLSIEEIAGLMLYSPHQAVPANGGPFPGTYCGGKLYGDAKADPWTLSDQQHQFLEKEHIRHILLTTVQSAEVSAKWSNALQAEAERLPHGIPVNISTDPRNGARESTAEFKLSGADVSKWPEGVGFAACFDPSVVAQFAHDASLEYRALGITTALGPQIDLNTEPRWMRYIDTLGEDLEQNKLMTKAYCDGMQTTENSEDGWGMDSVNTMVKHWPGGGTGEGGRDAHYSYGEFNVYPGGNSGEHMKPFTEAAFCLDGPTKTASAVMPYYSISWGLDTVYGQNVGNSYSRYLIHDLLRGTCDYKGVVCTDWGITGDPGPMDAFASRCYGVQQLTTVERHLLAIMNGVDQFGGNWEMQPIVEAYAMGCEKYGEETMRQRYELSAARLLLNIFRCGLFENPYLDPEQSAKIVGCEEFVRHGFEAQKKSVVLLKNRSVPETTEIYAQNKKTILPLKKQIRVYIPERRIGAIKNFMRFTVPEHTVDPINTELVNKYAVRVADPKDADVAIVFVESPQCDCYSPDDVAAGGNGYLPITLQYRPYTAAAAREVSIAGGDPREDFTNRSYKDKTNTACNEADLDNILDCRAAMGEKPVIVCAAINNPMVMSEFEPAADAIVAEFGVSRKAVMDILFGEGLPGGRLPMQLPKDMETVEKQSEDVGLDMIPYTDSESNRYDYGFGLSYEE